VSSLGTTLPEAELTHLDGSRLWLSQALPAGRVLLVIGHCECPTTRLSAQFVDRIHRQGGAATLVLQDDARAAHELCSELQLALPVLLDPPPHPASRALAIVAVPTSILLDDDGRVSQLQVGFDREALETAARALGLTPPLFSEADGAPRRQPG
jgi:hypothetical protein